VKPAVALFVQGCSKALGVDANVHVSEIAQNVRVVYSEKSIVLSRAYCETVDSTMRKVLPKLCAETRGKKFEDFAVVDIRNLCKEAGELFSMLSQACTGTLLLALEVLSNHALTRLISIACSRSWRDTAEGVNRIVFHTVPIVATELMCPTLLIALPAKIYPPDGVLVADLYLRYLEGEKLLDTTIVSVTETALYVVCRLCSDAFDMLYAELMVLEETSKDPEVRDLAYKLMQTVEFMKDRCRQGFFSNVFWRLVQY